MKRLLISAVLFCGVAWCQTEVMPSPDPITHALPARFLTMGLYNGHYWNALTELHKAGFVVGFAEGFADLMPCQAGLQFPNLTFGEIQMRVDGFYADAKNINIPIVDAIMAINPEYESKMVLAVERLRVASDAEHK